MEKFRLNTKIEVYQDQGGVLYNADDEQLTHIRALDIGTTCKSYKKVLKPHRLKIVLGNKCNLSCSYCLQDALSERETFGNQVDALLDKIDLSAVEKIELWGGEPLMYWHYIKQIIDKVDREGINWLIISNGSLLKEKHLKFFEQMKGNLAVTISHDGPGQEELRGEDILPTKGGLLKEMSSFAKLSFNSIITNQNYNLFEIEDFLGSYDFYHNYELGEAYDYHGVKYVVQGENLQKYDKILRAYLKESTRPNSFGQDVESHLRFIMDPYEMPTWSRCGIDQEEQLTVDLEGNIKPCQNVGKEFISGSIDDIENVSLQNVTFGGTNRCKTCEVQNLCQSGCPYNTPDINLFNVNCSINYTHYKAIQDTAYKMLFQED